MGIGIVTGGVLTFGPLPVIAIMALSAVIIALIIVLVVVVRDSRR